MVAFYFNSVGCLHDSFLTAEDAEDTEKSENTIPSAHSVFSAVYLIPSSFVFTTEVTESAERS